MQAALHARQEAEVHLGQVVVQHARRDARLVHAEREHDQIEHQLHVLRNNLRQLVRRAPHVRRGERRPPAFEPSVTRRTLDAFFDVANGFQVVVELSLVG
jgi:hypothetical protein